MHVPRHDHAPGNGSLRRDPQRQHRHRGQEPREDRGGCECGASGQRPRRTHHGTGRAAHHSDTCGAVREGRRFS